MKKNMRKLCALLTIVFVYSCICTSPVSAKRNSDKGWVELTNSLACDVAIDWGKTYAPDVRLQTNYGIPLLDVDGEIIGYCIDYFCDGEPWGYIILNFQFPCPIVEYVIAEGEIGKYAHANVSSAEKESGCCETPDWMYYISPLQYIYSFQGLNSNVETFDLSARDRSYEGISSHTDYRLVDSSRSTIDVDPENSESIIGEAREIKNRIINAYGNRISNSNTDDYTSVTEIYGLPSGLTRTEYGNLSSYSCYSESQIEQATGYYACAVVALTEIAAQKGYLLNQSVADTFFEIWDTTSAYVTSYNSNNNIYYGSTYTNQIGVGMDDYISSCGGTCSYTTSSAPTYYTYKNAVNAAKSSTFSYGISVNGSRSGHTVSVIGYYLATDSSSGTSYQFLRVANGWSSSAAYLNFSETSFLDKYAYVFTIS